MENEVYIYGLRVGTVETIVIDFSHFLQFLSIECYVSV